jgi:hypothetical protein
MTDQERLAHLLRSAFPPTTDSVPTRDLWPAVFGHGWARDEWSWIDLGVAAASALALALFPSLLWLLAYHL